MKSDWLLLKETNWRLELIISILSDYISLKLNKLTCFLYNEGAFNIHDTACDFRKMSYKVHVSPWFTRAPKISTCKSQSQHLRILALYPPLSTPVKYFVFTRNMGAVKPVLSSFSFIICLNTLEEFLGKFNIYFWTKGDILQ